MPLGTPGFDFASRDYENIRRDLLARASRVVPDWTDRDPSDFGMLFVDLWAYMGDVLHYYVDRAAGEAFITTATQRESVLALANLFDYTPFNRSSATATVYVSNSSSASVSLAAGTVFVAISDGSQYEFFSNQETTVLAGQTVGVLVTEGKKVIEEVLTTSANGQVNQKYSLSKTNAVPSSVQVYVYENGIDPTAWNPVPNISLSNSGNSVYSVIVNADNETQVLFGNRLSGRIPATNTKITATYNTTSGGSGNVGQNKISAFKTTQPVGLAVVSSTTATGGSNGETVDSIKSSLKAMIRSQDRAVTLQDYVDLALRVPSVYKAVVAYTPNASGGGGGSVSVYGMPYISEYTSYTSNSVAVTSTVQDEIEALIQPLSTLGVTVVAESSITLVPKTITATVYVQESYVAVSVQRAVERALDALFELPRIQFGVDIKIGDIYRAIHNVEGVEYATVTLGGSSPTNVQLIRKGSYTITTSGGITTSV